MGGTKVKVTSWFAENSRFRVSTKCFEREGDMKKKD